MNNHLWMIFVVLPGLVIIFFQYFIEFICCCDFACLVAVLVLFCALGVEPLTDLLLLVAKHAIQTRNTFFFLEQVWHAMFLHWP